MEIDDLFSQKRELDISEHRDLVLTDEAFVSTEPFDEWFCEHSRLYSGIVRMKLQATPKGIHEWPRYLHKAIDMLQQYFENHSTRVGFSNVHVQRLITANINERPNQDTFIWFFVNINENVAEYLNLMIFLRTFEPFFRRSVNNTPFHVYTRYEVDTGMVVSGVSECDIAMLHMHESLADKLVELRFGKGLVYSNTDVHKMVGEYASYIYNHPWFLGKKPQDVRLEFLKWGRRRLRYFYMMPEMFLDGDDIRVSSMSREIIKKKMTG